MSTLPVDSETTFSAPSENNSHGTRSEDALGRLTNPSLLQRLRKAAILVACGLSIQQAAKRLGIPCANLWQSTRYHPKAWERELKTARRALKLKGPPISFGDEEALSRMPRMKFKKMCAGIVWLSKGESMNNASRKIKKSKEFLARCLHDHPEAFHREWEKAGLPTVWGSEFDGVAIHIRLCMARGVAIVASGINIVESSQRMKAFGTGPKTLYQHIQQHPDLWDLLVERERRRHLLIPKGYIQQAVTGRTENRTGSGPRKFFPLPRHTHPASPAQQAHRASFRARIKKAMAKGGGNGESTRRRPHGLKYKTASNRKAEAKLYDDWLAARQAGTPTYDDFADDRRLGRSEVFAILERERKRRSRMERALAPDNSTTSQGPA